MGACVSFFFVVYLIFFFFGFCLTGTWGSFSKNEGFRMNDGGGGEFAGIGVRKKIVTRI